MIEPATEPTSPVLPRTILNTLLAAAFALIVVVGIAFLADQIDDSVKDAEAVQAATGLSTLGTIARMRSLPGREEFYQLAGILYPRSPVTEAYRALRTNVEFASVNSPLQTLLVTSARAPKKGRRSRPRTLPSCSPRPAGTSSSWTPISGGRRRLAVQADQHDRADDDNSGPCHYR